MYVDALTGNNEPDWSIRPYMAGDEHQLVALFGRVFGHTHDVAWWRWKLKGLESRVENVWVAVDQEERVIGQYAAIPVQIKLGGRLTEAMVSVDTMTAPEFRKRGVLTRLASAAYESWAEAGIAAVIGLPNQQWGSRTAALGWVPLFTLPWQRHLLHAERRIRAAPRIPSLLKGPVEGAASAVTKLAHGRTTKRLRPQSHHFEIVSDMRPELFDELWRVLSPEYQNALVRDARWVAWRYCKAVGAEYRVFVALVEGAPVGYVAYRLRRSDRTLLGTLADLFVAPGDWSAASSLLLAALEDLWTNGAESVSVASAPGSSLHALLNLAGFRKAEGAFSLETVPFDQSLNLAVLRDPATWQVALGDFDVV